jgi:hypothetical protein
MNEGEQKRKYRTDCGGLGEAVVVSGCGCDDNGKHAVGCGEG